MNIIEKVNAYSIFKKSDAVAFHVTKGLFPIYSVEKEGFTELCKNSNGAIYST